MRLASRENISASLVSLTSLARTEKCDLLSSLRVSQFVSLTIARLTNKQSQNSQREISVRLKFLARFFQDSRVKISNDSRESRYEISVCETRESRYEICLREFRSKTRFSRFSLWNFCLWDSREASLATYFDSWVSRKSRENFGSKKRVSLLAKIS